jgi:hypothetical protein
MAGISRTFISGYLFGIRSRNAFGPVAGKRQSSAETKDGDDLLGLNRREGQPTNQFLLIMIHA